MNSTNNKKTVIVTGGSKGIGKATSLAFAKKGYNVIISARSEAPELLKEIKALGGEATFIKTDISKEEDVLSLIDQTVKKYGKLDVIVNNAAIVGTVGLPLVETTTQNFESLFKTNVLGSYWGMKYAIQAMLKTGGGSVVNISSVGGTKGAPGMGHYIATKHALVGLSKATALEYATQNIRVNIVSPGPILTEMLESAGEEFVGTVKEKVPTKKIGDVSDVAKAVLFLAADDVPFMTGADLAVDGGLSAL